MKSENYAKENNPSSSMKTTLSVGIAVFSLSSCTQYVSEMYGHFDARNKTMSVPPGMDGPKSQIKAALRKHGWKLYASGMGTTMEQQGSSRLLYADTSAKYKMLLEYNMTQNDLILGKEYYYNLSIIENRSGQEVMTAQGARTNAHVFAEHLMTDISSHTY